MIVASGGTPAPPSKMLVGEIGEDGRGCKDVNAEDEISATNKEDEEDGDEFSILEEEGTNDLMNDRVTAETRKGGEEAEDEEEL